MHTVSTIASTIGAWLLIGLVAGIGIERVLRRWS